MFIEIHSQSCIEKIVISYIPFEIKDRTPVSIEEFELIKPTDTISNLIIVNEILLKFQELQKGGKIKCDLFSPKMLCRIYMDKEELLRFYYTSFQRVYYNGFYFEDDKGLFPLILSNIASDDIFLEKLRNRN
jgi:hypothetical protein